jgi:hypothetical protein
MFPGLRQCLLNGPTLFTDAIAGDYQSSSISTVLAMDEDGRRMVTNCGEN